MEVEVTLEKSLGRDPNFWMFKNVSRIHHIEWISQYLWNGIMAMIIDVSYYPKLATNMATSAFILE